MPYWAQQNQIGSVEIKTLSNQGTWIILVTSQALCVYKNLFKYEINKNLAVRHVCKSLKIMGILQICTHTLIVRVNVPCTIWKTVKQHEETRQKGPN